MVYATSGGKFGEQVGVKDRNWPRGGCFRRGQKAGNAGKSRPGPKFPGIYPVFGGIRAKFADLRRRCNEINDERKNP